MAALTIRSYQIIVRWTCSHFSRVIVPFATIFQKEQCVPQRRSRNPIISCRRGVGMLRHTNGTLVLLQVFEWRWKAGFGNLSFLLCHSCFLSKPIWVQCCELICSGTSFSSRLNNLAACGLSTLTMGLIGKNLALMFSGSPLFSAPDSSRLQN